MSTPQRLIAIRTRKLGLLIYDARTASRRTLEDCAEAVGISASQFESYEKGLAAPSLPEIEALAFYLDIPIEHFWGSTSLVEKSNLAPKQTNRLLRLRHRIIGTHLRLGRSKTNRTLKELSEKALVPENDLKSFEMGDVPVPLPVLELLASAMDMRIEDFFAEGGPIGNWRENQHAVKAFLDLSPEMQEFVCKPINRPYLQLAMRLSDLSVERLRTIAEGLLEITY
jgi:hypothetical protein